MAGYVSASDLKQIGLLATFAPFAVLPEMIWPLPCMAVERITSRRMFRHWRELESRLPPELYRRANMTLAQFLHQAEQRYLEDYLQLLRSHVGGRWKPRIDVVGAENIESALAAGHGAVLWVSGSLSSDLVSKMGLRQAGFRVSHLSRPSHGFSATPFGVRFLNPIRQRSELRYLRERIVMDGDRSIGALRAVRERLKANGVVSISAGDASRTILNAPLLGGSYRLATGPAQLARGTGAALLPVFTARVERGRYQVRVGARIDQRPSPPNSRDFSPEVERFINLLDAYTAQWPLEWTGWRTGSLVISAG